MIDSHTHLMLCEGSEEELVAAGAAAGVTRVLTVGMGAESDPVAAFPALLRREECDAALRAMAEDLEGLDRGAGVQAAIKRVAATMACHAAVKANYPLTAEKMSHLLDELRRTAYSTICPHGRPVMLRLTRREVEKNFQRI